MPDWFLPWIGHIQGGIMRTLATELRTGSIGTAAFAFALGALHALTPGHGKAALAAYFLGREAHVSKGLRIALTASLLHVLSGFAAFILLRFVIGQVPSMFGRGSPTFTAFGYMLIIFAGMVMTFQSLRPARSHADEGHALTAGIGLLPCPLTISVLGFAWTQSGGAMVGLVLISLALGIALTIGAVAVGAIFARATMGAALGPYLPALDRGSRILQGLGGLAIIAIGLLTLRPLLL